MHAVLHLFLRRGMALVLLLLIALPILAVPALVAVAPIAFAQGEGGGMGGGLGGGMGGGPMQLFLKSLLFLIPLFLSLMRGGGGQSAPQLNSAAEEQQPMIGSVVPMQTGGTPISIAPPSSALLNPSQTSVLVSKNELSPTNSFVGVGQSVEFRNPTGEPITAKIVPPPGVRRPYPAQLVIPPRTGGRDGVATVPFSDPGVFQIQGLSGAAAVLGTINVIPVT